MTLLPFRHSTLRPALLPLVSILIGPVSTSFAAVPPEGSAGASPSVVVDQQVEDLLKVVRGHRVAMLTNPTGVDSQLNFIADLLHQDPQTTLTAFFAAEHGLRGDVQAGGSVATYNDPHTGVPVYSVYGAVKAPTAEQLKDIDILIFDIQDVGVRFYTFAWSMTYAMEAAAKSHVKFVVFDRPNPIGGMKVEGAVNHSDYGLVGRLWPGQRSGVATRHGMTVGELAQLVNGEWLNPKADLTVIPIPGYTRNTSFDATGRPWVIPSPNMPTVDTATVYPGMCVFEGVNISEGRGTTKPFEQVGAPFIDGVALAADLNALGLPGVRFRPAYFQPTFDDLAGQYCGGIQVHVMNRDTFDPIRTALHAVQTLCRKYPDKVTISPFAGKLMAVPDLADRIKTESVEDIIASWQTDLAAFKAVRAKYLIYPEASGSKAPRAR